MKLRNRRRTARQMALPEQGAKAPVWSTVPEESRREVVELLMELLRSVAVNDEEDGDE